MASDKRFKVKLLRGYFPADPAWPQKTGVDGGFIGPTKALRDSIIDLPLDEAKDIIKKGIAERADDYPIQ
jgi:hypothetical protein